MRNTELKKLESRNWENSDNETIKNKQLLIINDDYFATDEIDFFPSAISDSCTLVLL
jgi:hypothetical protein